MSVNSRPARLYVANRRAKPIVRTPGRGGRRPRPGPPGPRRAGRTGCAAGHGRRSPARASGAGGPPTGRRRDPLEPLPEAVLAATRVERVEVGVEVAAEQLDDRRPTQVGPWTPLVMPRIAWSMTLLQVALAVSAWSWLTAFAPWVSRRLKAVMSNWPRSPSVPSPSSRTARPARRRRRAADRRRGGRGRRRSARCRPRPACGS